MRALAPGILALVSGAWASVTATLSLTSIMSEMGMMRPDPLPSYLLLTLGLVILVNGLLLIFRMEMPMRPQGVVMLLYGLLMLIVGTSMITTDLFSMQMSVLSATAMYVLGTSMIVSGGLMVAARRMSMPPAGSP